MLQSLIDAYVPLLVTGFALVVLLQTVKAAVAKAVKVPGVVWWLIAWAVGFGATFVLPNQCASGDWRCLIQQGIALGAAAIIIYPISKRIVGTIRDKLTGGQK